MSDVLDMAIAALRDDACNGVDDGEATRRRVMASMGTRSRGRKWRVGFAVLAFALSTATLSWAASTGKLDAVLERVGIPASGSQTPTKTRAPTRSLPAPLPQLGSQPRLTPNVQSQPQPLPQPLPQPQPQAIPAPRPRSGVRTARPIDRALPGEHAPVSAASAPPAVDPDLLAYRRAHEQHFRGGDAAQALAAWDAYLAAYPTGRFATEARYNRAIAMVKLGRQAEAKAELLPFARGDVEGGYRQHEAKALVDALESP